MVDDNHNQVGEGAPAELSAEEAALARGRQLLAQQPFSVLLGTQLHALSPGAVELHLPLTEKLYQQYGFAHGGVVSYMADNALTYAGGTAMKGMVITSEFKINYLRPGRGKCLIARARAVHVGKSQSVCSCQIFDVQDDGVEKLCAVAQGTIVRMSPREKPAS